MGETPIYKLPYPEADTLITDSAGIVKDLAEKIDAALAVATASDAYTVPGTLIHDFTTSGTFTPPAGVTEVNVVIIGGGRTGGTGGTLYIQPAYGWNGHVVGEYQGRGGNGGDVRVFNRVQVTQPIAVTVGGAGEASSFGTLSAKPGAPFTGYGWQVSPSGNPNCSIGGVGGFASGTNDNLPPQNGAGGAHGAEGPTVNGTHYAGGGGGGGRSARGGTRGAGGAGGGGDGYWNDNNTNPGEPGTPGTGGGGGGGGRRGDVFPGGLGGSGRVMVFTEQSTDLDTIPAATLIEQALALDADGLVIGDYAVDPTDPELPGVDHAGLVPMPNEPQPTGKTIVVPVNPDEPDGPTHEIPILGWPEAGWTYTNGTWTAPPEGNTDE